MVALSTTNRLPISEQLPLMKLLMVMLAYLVTGWLGLQLPYAGSHITLIWLPTGIALAALLRWGWRMAPAIYLAALLTNLTTGSTLLLASSIALGNVLAPLFATWWLLRMGFHTQLDRRKDVGLLLIAACMNMAVSATGGVISLELAGALAQENMGGAWVSWWMGDTVGVLLAAPLLLTFTRDSWNAFVSRRIGLVLWLIIALPIAWFAFARNMDATGQSLALTFLTLPLFVWAALSFGITGASLAGLLFSVFAALSVGTGHGSLLHSDSHVSLLLLWSYMATTVLIGLIINALLAERNKVEKILRASEANLRISASAFEAQVGIIVTDLLGTILRVNHTFVEHSGYTADEVVGKNPRILQSGRHGADFYTEMWANIYSHGAWSGEIWDKRKDGKIYPKWMTITAVKDPAGIVTHYVSTQFDITDSKAKENEIKLLAFYDPLTGLPNRRHLLERLHQAVSNCSRHHKQGALIFIDLDNFKTLNDTLGHDKGDDLLRQAAQRLTSCVRDGDTVARLGGDEFVVMLEGLDEQNNEAAAQADAVGQKIIATLAEGYLLDNHEHQSTASAGIALFGEQGASIDELMKHADMAMYQAKAGGRNALRFFDPTMQAAMSSRVDLEKDLRAGIREQQFVLYYQAQVNGQQHIRGAEVLLRWQHPTRGIIYPDQFIQVLEDTKLIVPLGMMILDTACEQLAKWALDESTAHLILAVNVSVHQLREADFVQQVLAVLERNGTNPQRLKLELTESLLLNDTEDTITKMAALKAHGIGFSLDDFGTGFSSLSYLKRLPLEKLKIDKTFVRDVMTDPNDAAIANTIIVLAHSMGLGVVAEGVETLEQQNFLAEHECHLYQGYLFSKPIPLEDFERLVSTPTPLQ